ncbi:hypothetical protein FACS189498_2600 [Spirochaetia bacterium]|nr:hypothetical protein FACS189498_2600 [Spirochaetia bacterium]
MNDIVAVDSVVFNHNNYWWIFTGVGDESNGVNKNLSAFYSETFPSGNWTAHPQNPIVSGLHNSRMAGAVFHEKKCGRLIRPAQNCLKDYGKEVNINAILELSPLVYREKIIKTIRPERDLSAVCTHTINHSDTYMLRDIKTRKWRFIP